MKGSQLKGDKEDKGNKIYRVSIAFNREDYIQFTEFCRTHGISKSYCARRCIMSTIAEYDNEYGRPFL